MLGNVPSPVCRSVNSLLEHARPKQVIECRDRVPSLPLTVMPKRPDTKEFKSLDDRGVDAKHRKAQPKRGRKATLPIRTGRAPGQRSDLTQRTRISHHRDAIFTAASHRESLADSKQSASEKSDDFEGLFPSQQIVLRQWLTDVPPEPESSSSYPSDHSGLLRSRIYTQDHARPDVYDASPYVILGSGGGDPFSALPSDLPKSFIEERLYTSK